MRQIWGRYILLTALNMFDVSGSVPSPCYEVNGCRHTDILCTFFETDGGFWAGGWTVMFWGSIMTIVNADVYL